MNQPCNISKNRKIVVRYQLSPFPAFVCPFYPLPMSPSFNDLAVKPFQNIKLEKGKKY